MSKELEELKKIITGILVSTPLRLTVGKIDRDYAELVGERIPFRKFGFNTLDGCLNSMKDILEVIGTGPYAEVVLVVSDKSSHINNLVTKQKINKPKRKPRFGSAPSRFRRKTVIHQGYNKSFMGGPLPLLSLNFPQKPIQQNSFPQNSFPKKSFSQFPVNVDQTKVTNFKLKNENSDNENKVANVVTENKNFFESEQSSTCNGTIPKQPISYKISENVDSDNSDNEYVYLSDTDDEYDDAHLQNLQNVDYTTQEHIYEEESENKIATSAKSSYSTNVPLSIQNNLKKLISQYKDGIWCGTLPDAYKKMFKKELDYAEYGYRSLITMCMDLNEVFYCIRPDTGDFKLFDRQSELPKDHDKGIQISQLFKYFRDHSDKPSTEPAVIDLESEILFSYPEDVLKLNEEIARQFLPDNIKENDYIDVCVGEVYDPSKFWILLDEFTDQLNNLMDQLQTFYTSIDNDYSIPENMITVGLYCAAEYNGEYHRAIIVNTIESVKDKVKVYYIDYGTVSAVKPESLKFLHKKFTKLPQQAIRARLASIYPPTEKSQWSCDASTRFLELVTMKTLVAHIHRIDTERQIVEVFLVDTTGEDDVYMNDSLVEEGYAIFTNQEQTRISLKPHATPWVKHLHLFPTFLEIENGAVPNAIEMMRLQKVGIPLEQIYSRYFVQENTHDELLCNDIKDVESINEDASKHKEKAVANEPKDNPTDVLDVSKKDESEIENKLNESTFDTIEEVEHINTECSAPELVYSNPPPGFENVIRSQNMLPKLTPTVLPNYPFTSTYMPVPNMMPQYNFTAPQQFYFQNVQTSFIHSYSFNPYGPDPSSIFRNERLQLLNVIHQFLVRNAYSQVTLINYLVQQGQWQYTSSPGQICAYLNTILNTPISDLQRNHLLKEVLNVLTDTQIVDLLQKLSMSGIASYQNYENTQIDRTSNLLGNLNLNQSNSFTDVNKTSNSQENLEKHNEEIKKKDRLVADVDLNGKQICIIWYCKELHVNIEEIMQVISNKLPIEHIRKQIVMVDPTISIIDLPLSNHEHLYEEIARYRKNIDKQAILHIVPVASIQKVLYYLGSTLDVSAFLTKVNANRSLWFETKPL